MEKNFQIEAKRRIGKHKEKGIYSRFVKIARNLTETEYENFIQNLHYKADGLEPYDGRVIKTKNNTWSIPLVRYKTIHKSINQ